MLLCVFPSTVSEEGRERNFKGTTDLPTADTFFKMSTNDLRDKLDGLNNVGRMDSVYPEPMSRLHRGLGPVRIIADIIAIIIITFSFFRLIV